MCEVDAKLSRISMEELLETTSALLAKGWKAAARPNPAVYADRQGRLVLQVNSQEEDKRLGKTRLSDPKISIVKFGQSHRPPCNRLIAATLDGQLSAY